MKKIFVDVGSMTTKAYILDGEKLSHLKNVGINYKSGFEPEVGISAENKEKLFGFIKELKEDYPGVEIGVYATAVFRKMASEVQEKFCQEFKDITGVDFQVVSHVDENRYLELGLVKECNLSEPVLLTNIGGGSTELVVMQEGEAIERKNIDYGVGVINSQYPELNESISGIGLDQIVVQFKQKLPEMENTTEVAFYSGGELKYMQLVGYKLVDNELFEDVDHPSVIDLADFKSKNAEVFSKISLGELEGLMSENPAWMHGARGCSALAQAIFEKYGIKKIIPSNVGLIEGVVAEESIRKN